MFRKHTNATMICVSVCYLFESFVKKEQGEKTPCTHTHEERKRGRMQYLPFRNTHERRQTVHSSKCCDDGEHTHTYTHHFFPMSKCVCLCMPVKKERRKLQRQSDIKMHPASTISAELSSARLNKMKQKISVCSLLFCLISHFTFSRIHMTFSFSVRRIHTPGLTSATFEIYVYDLFCLFHFYVFKTQRMGLFFLLFRFVSVEVNRKICIGWLAECIQHIDRQTDKQIDRKAEGRRRNGKKSVMFVQSNECCSARMKRIDSALAFFSFSFFSPFYSAQPYFHTFTCILKRYSTIFFR